MPDVISFDLAKYLYHAENLSPKDVGAFVIDKHGQELLEDFLMNQQMAGVAFPHAVREALSHIKLMGETSEVENYMKAIANVYKRQNPNTPYCLKAYQALSVGAILLNVNHHSPVQSKKHVPMTLKQFIGIFSEHELDTEIIEDLFNDIAANEIILPNEQGEVSSLSYDWKKEAARDQTCNFTIEHMPSESLA